MPTKISYISANNSAALKSTWTSCAVIGWNICRRTKFSLFCCMPERRKETKWSWLLVVGAKSLSENQFVAGDDFGKLKLYNYPVIKPKVLRLTSEPSNLHFCLNEKSGFKVHTYRLDCQNYWFFSFSEIHIFLIDNGDRG